MGHACLISLVGEKNIISEGFSKPFMVKLQVKVNDVSISQSTIRFNSC